jgi:hypothetical protein
VKPFVKSNKNDFVDAEAIAEAVERKNMRFVPIKTDDQLDLQAIHRVRDRLIARRTAVINQLLTFSNYSGTSGRWSSNSSVCPAAPAIPAASAPRMESVSLESLSWRVTMRWASVAGVTRKARAISSVVRPQISRRVSATCPSGGSAGWQQVKIRRQRELHFSRVEGTRDRSEIRRSENPTRQSEVRMIERVVRVHPKLQIDRFPEGERPRYQTSG